MATFFPKYVAKIIKIIFSTESNLKNENEIILDPSFEFKRKIKSKGRSCSISYIYKSLSSRVEQSMISTYIKNSNKARDLLKFTICEHDNSSFNKISENTDMLNWPIFLLLVIAFLVYMHFARKIYINQSEVSFEKNENSKLYGIKGWLFLLSFSVILSSFQIIIDAYQTASLILSHNSWLELSSNTNNNPFSLPFIFLEAITNIGLFVLWPLMSLLLLKKKPLFPRLFVYLLFLNLVILIFDNLISFFFFSTELLEIDIKSMVLMGFRLLFWGWYIAKSERVKVTFGKNYSFFSKDTNSDPVASDPK